MNSYSQTHIGGIFKPASCYWEQRSDEVIPIATLYAGLSSPDLVILVLQVDPTNYQHNGVANESCSLAVTLTKFFIHGITLNEFSIAEIFAPQLQLSIMFLNLCRVTHTVLPFFLTVLTITYYQTP